MNSNTNTIILASLSKKSDAKEDKTEPEGFQAGIDLFNKGLEANLNSAFSQAIKCFQRAYPLFKKEKQLEPYLIYCAYHLGLNYKAINEPRQALPYFEEASALIAGSEPEDYLLSLNEYIVLHSGICHETVGEYPIAISKLESLVDSKQKKSLNYLDEENHSRAQAHLGHCYLRLKQFSKANFYFEQATLSTNSTIKILACQQLGISFYMLNELTQAEKWLLEAYTAQRKQSKENPEFAETCHFLGFVHLKNGAYRKALSVLNEALTYYINTLNSSASSACRLALGLCYESLGEYTLACAQFDAIIANLESDDDLELIWDIISNAHHFSLELSTKSSNTKLNNTKQTLIELAKTKYSTRNDKDDKIENTSTESKNSSKPKNAITSSFKVK